MIDPARTVTLVDGPGANQQFDVDPSLTVLFFRPFVPGPIEVYHVDVYDPRIAYHANSDYPAHLVTAAKIVGTLDEHWAHKAGRQDAEKLNRRFFELLGGEESTP